MAEKIPSTYPHKSRPTESGLHSFGSLRIGTSAASNLQRNPKQQNLEWGAVRHYCRSLLTVQVRQALECLTVLKPLLIRGRFGLLLSIKCRFIVRVECSTIDRENVLAQIALWICRFLVPLFAGWLVH